MRNAIRILAGLCCLLCVASLAAAELSPARVFSSHMVLQREKPAPVWGWDKAGQKITVRFAGQCKITKAGKDGKWMVKLDPLKLSVKPQTMTLAGSSTVTFTDVLVGDVWLCSGQSNMGRNVGRHPRPEGMSMEHPLIRFIGGGKAEKYPRERLPAPADPAKAGWRVCTGEQTLGCCATGFYFARRVQQDFKVPIGILWQAWAGSIIQEWIPRHGWRLEPELADMADKVDQWYPSTPHGRKVWKAHLAEIETWLAKADKALADGTPFPYPQPLMPEPKDRDICGFYNGKIHPVAPFAIKGVLWYQGESDMRNARWAIMLKAMAKSWRGLFSEGDGEDIAFYWMQIQRSGDYCSPLVRDQQFKALKLVPNSGMAVLMDHDVNVHPANKVDGGIRLALWALAKQYGKKRIVYSGPLYKSHKVAGDKIIIEFDHAETGLMLGKKDMLNPVEEMPTATLKNVKIAGKDKRWTQAVAKIVGKTLVVSSDDVPQPVAVRYCYENIPPEPFLYNKAGLPTAQFRTDDW